MSSILKVNHNDDADIDYRYEEWLKEKKLEGKQGFPMGCNLCGGDVILADNAIIYGRNYNGGKVYYCLKCNNYVGTHKEDDKPLGLICDPETRKARIHAHEIFDNFFKSKLMTRKNSYVFLQAIMNLSKEEAHISRFDKYQCGELISKIKRLRNMLNSISI